MAVTVGRVIAADGSAAVLRGGGPAQPLQIGEDLHPGDVIVTADAPLLIAGRGDDGAAAVIAWNSVVALGTPGVTPGGMADGSGGAAITLTLIAGAVLATIPPGGCSAEGAILFAAGGEARVLAGGAYAVVTDDPAGGGADLEVAGVATPDCAPAVVQIRSAVETALLSDLRYYAAMDGATGDIRLLPLVDWADAQALETLAGFAEAAAALAGLETAAGPDAAAADAPAPAAVAGFDLDYLPVTAGLGLSDSLGYPSFPALTRPTQPGDAPAAFVRADHSADAPLPAEAPLLAAAPPPPPTRIVDIDGSGWSSIGAAWQALMPNTVVAAAIPFRLAGDPFYRTAATSFDEARSGTGLEHLRFAPPFDDATMLVVVAQDRPAGPTPGGLAGALAGDIIGFLGFDPLPWRGVDGEPVAAADGAALKARVAVQPGTALAFEVLFDPVAPGASVDAANDFAFVGVNGEPLTILDAATTTGPASGWRTVVVSASETITELAFGVLNAGDSLGDPQLAIDNLRLLPAPALAEGDRIVLGGVPLQAIDVIASGGGGSARAVVLVRPPLAADDAPPAPIGANETLITRAGSADPDHPGVLANDAAGGPGWTQVVADAAPLRTGDVQDYTYPNRVAAVAGDAGGVGVWMPATRDDGDYGGRIRLHADGGYDFDPDGAFADLRLGELATTTIGYTVAADSGGWDTATLTLTVEGRSTIEDFDGTGAPTWQTAGTASALSRYAEASSGDGRVYDSLDGSDRFLVVAANTPIPGQPHLVGTPQRLITPFLGLNEPGSNSAAVLAGLDHTPIGGGAVRFDRPLQAGDVLSFYFAFDATDLAQRGGLGSSDGVLFNDLAAFVFDGDVFPLATGAGVDPPGGSARPGSTAVWFATFVVPEDVDDDSFFAFWVSDDAPTVNDVGGTPEPAALLIDAIAVNAAVPDGYASVTADPASPLTFYAPAAAP